MGFDKSDISIPLTSSSSGGAIAVLTIAPACRGETVPLVLRGATYRRVAHYKVLDPSALPAVLVLRLPGWELDDEV